MLQLLDRNPATRLGMPNSPHGAIREHQYFRSIDWERLERRQLEPPFKPKLVCTPQLLYTSLFTKMVVKRRRRKNIYTYIQKIQQTKTEAKIKNKHMLIIMCRYFCGKNIRKILSVCQRKSEARWIRQHCYGSLQRVATCTVVILNPAHAVSS